MHIYYDTYECAHVQVCAEMPLPQAIPYGRRNTEYFFGGLSAF